jgi:predicted metalloprotease with PDZ domain
MKRFFVLCFFVAATASFHAAAPIRYRLSFPQPQHRWMQVEASFPELGSGTLELRMSRSSPGRYSLHDFAKNVYDVHVFAADGRELEATRPDPYGWNVAGHGGSLTVRYKVFGDRSMAPISASIRPTRTSTCRRPSCGRTVSTIGPSR